MPQEGENWKHRKLGNTLWIVEVIPSPWKEDGLIVRFQPAEKADVEDMDLDEFLGTYELNE
jgi:hypothetical protein